MFLFHRKSMDAMNINNECFLNIKEFDEEMKVRERKTTIITNRDWTKRMF